MPSHHAIRDLQECGLEVDPSCLPDGFPILRESPERRRIGSVRRTMGRHDPQTGGPICLTMGVPAACLVTPKGQTMAETLLSGPTPSRSLTLDARRRRQRVLRTCLALSAATAGLQCVGPRFAPDDSRIEVSASPVALVSGGDTAIVSALVTEEDGQWVEDGTNVTFTATGGSLCRSRPRVSPQSIGCDSISGQLLPAVSAQTRRGLVTVLFVSGSTSGSGSVKAVSAGATGTAQLTISGLLAPQTATVVVQASPDTLPLNAAATVLAFFTTAEGTSVGNATRVVFAADGGRLSHAIASTQDGFAQTVVTATREGPLVITATSGLATGRDTIIVRAAP